MGRARPVPSLALRLLSQEAAGTRRQPTTGERTKAMTHHVTSMLETYPKDLGGLDRQKLADCITACFECAQTCTACADACLSEGMVAELTKCIRTNLDCADICATTGRILSRHTGYDANITHAAL